MAYKSRRDRKRAHGGATKAEVPAEVRDWRHGKPVRKYRRGGHVEGEAAKHHLGKRARGGGMEAKEAADHPDGVDKEAMGRPEREEPFGSPRKRGGRADGGGLKTYREDLMSLDHPKQGGGPGGQAGLYNVQSDLGDRNSASPPQTDKGPPVRKRGGRADGGSADCEERARGGHVVHDLHGHRVEHADGHEEVHRKREERKRGGRLTAHERQGLPKADFALPGKGSGPKGAGAGSYPIPDESHARNALARVAQHGSPAEQATVRRKVHAKYPDIGEG